MAKYQITSPSGEKFEINAPEGASESDVMFYAKSNFQRMSDPNAKYKAKQRSEKIDVTDDMNILETGAAGLGKMMVDTGRGVKQLLGIGGKQLQDTIDSESALSKDLMNTWGGNIGNIAGNVGLAVLPGGAVIRAGNMLRAPAAVAAGRAMMAPGFTIPGLAVGGAMGAAQGGLQAVATGEDRLDNVGMGAVGGALLPALGIAGGVVRAGLQPLYAGGREQIIGNAVRRAAGPNANAVAQRLDQAQPLVPGTLPTAAEVADSGGVAALQRAASAVDPEAYTHRAAQNNLARVEELRDLAGTGGEREFHNLARRDAAEKLYKEAYDKGVDIFRDPNTGAFLPKAVIAGRKAEITKLLQRPAIQEAMEEARTLAANEGVKLTNAAGSVKGLDYVKRALDDKIKKAEGNEARVLGDLKNRLLTTIDALSPKYAEARTTFSQMSRPINQMDVSQEIADKSINRLTDTLQPNAFARAYSDDTVSRVTGMRNGTIGNTMEANQINRLNAIQEDLRRVNFSQNAGRGSGSDTLQKLSMANLLNRAGLPVSLGEVWGINKIAKFIYGETDQQMMRQLADVMQNPRDLARIMRAAQGNPNMLANLERARRIGSPLAIGIGSSNSQ